MAYSADGTRWNIANVNIKFNICWWVTNYISSWSIFSCRLFSCGTSKEGDSHLVEWNETEGAIKRTYNGFRKRSLGVVQFDTTRNRFLAAGDEFLVKFWDMDNNNILTTTDCDGGLPVSIFLFLIPVRAVCLGVSPCLSAFKSWYSFLSQCLGDVFPLWLSSFFCYHAEAFYWYFAGKPSFEIQ